MKSDLHNKLITLLGEASSFNLLNTKDEMAPQIEAARETGAQIKKGIAEAITLLTESETRQGEFYELHRCMNLRAGFNCMCKWEKEHPGEINFNCEWCGIYKASEARCNKCEQERV